MKNSMSLFLSAAFLIPLGILSCLFYIYYGTMINIHFIRTIE